jgi:hypothetical protein
LTTWLYSPEKSAVLFAGHGEKRLKTTFLSYTPAAFERKKKDRK